MHFSVMCVKSVIIIDPNTLETRCLLSFYYYQTVPLWVSGLYWTWMDPDFTSVNAITRPCGDKVL